MIVLLASPVAAQRGGRVSIVGNAGVVWPIMHHPSTERFDTHAALLSGALLNYGISDWLGLQVGLLLSEQRVETDRDENNTMTTQELVMQLRWNVLTGLWQPYLTAGANYYVVSLDPPLDDESDPGMVFGAGVELIFTDHISFGLTGRYGYIFMEHFDSGEMVSGLATLAFTF
ncbi:MAG: outer membrane beta-barrel protein [Candidatus Lernaella stagnicola]|nr:outer membrane beta-barrel protein [Candidatus Lernaella stagnicola]